MSGDMLADVKAAMKSGEVRITLAPTLMPGGDAVRIEVKRGSRFMRTGPLIFPPEGGSIADVLQMLGEFRSES